MHNVLVEANKIKRKKERKSSVDKKRQKSFILCHFGAADRMRNLGQESNFTQLPFSRFGFSSCMKLNMLPKLANQKVAFSRAVIVIMLRFYFGFALGSCK